MRTIVAVAIAVWAWLIGGFSAPVAAEDFRIETKVFVGRSKTPASENLTLFQSGTVYDYLSGPDRIAVFDKPRGRFILLDPVRELKFEVKTDDVMVFAKKLRELAAKNSSAFMKFAAQPEFETKLSQDGELRLSSKYLTYRLKTEPAPSPEAADQYHDFSDWYARFNAMTNPHSTPPFPRLAVNAELADRGLVPTEVHLSVSGQGGLGGRSETMRTEHHVSWRLLESDLEKIAETANQLAAFKVAELAELQPKRPATTKR
jgi:hypothetical protein